MMSQNETIINKMIKLAEFTGIKYEIHDKKNLLIEFYDNKKKDFFGNIIKKTSSDGELSEIYDQLMVLCKDKEQLLANTNNKKEYVFSKTDEEIIALAISSL